MGAVSAELQPQLPVAKPHVRMGGHTYPNPLPTSIVSEYSIYHRTRTAMMRVKVSQQIIVIFLFLSSGSTLYIHISMLCSCSSFFFFFFFGSIIAHPSISIFPTLFLVYRQRSPAIPTFLSATPSHQVVGA